EDDRLGWLETGQRVMRRAPLVSDRIADARIRNLLDLGCDVADLAGPKRGDLQHLRPEDADAVDFVNGVRRHHPNPRALLERPVDHADKDDDAEIGVVPGIDEEGLKRRRLIALWRR